MSWPYSIDEKQPKWVAPVAIAIILAGWGGFYYQQGIEARRREAVLDLLNNLSAAATVTIDGEAREATPVLEALRGLQDSPAHHSHPLASHQVEIRDGSAGFTLVVARDSDEPNEYWVFWPSSSRRHRPPGEPLGGIETRDLANHLPTVADRKNAPR